MLTVENEQFLEVVEELLSLSSLTSELVESMFFISRKGTKKNVNVLSI
ncbi:hypothetical protein Cylst_3495 [Cylindrospermum stagnale PCC 7417]|uniref:Uncharacterized protein n=1 Tax=Cylindrospermum stagnale PCC 7417 TaxID=56107 RepID=K9WZL1_9NOST|nr:hypothetical protein Cylst_3495 [Cylindrospermum stagnale PCC 7417]